MKKLNTIIAIEEWIEELNVFNEEITFEKYEKNEIKGYGKHYRLNGKNEVLIYISNKEAGQGFEGNLIYSVWLSNEDFEEAKKEILEDIGELTPLDRNGLWKKRNDLMEDKIILLEDIIRRKKAIEKDLASAKKYYLSEIKKYKKRVLLLSKWILKLEIHLEKLGEE